MEVIYKFDLSNHEIDDMNELKIFQKADKFFLSLYEISDYLREIRKGWKDDNSEQMEEYISEIISNSGIFEIE